MTMECEVCRRGIDAGPLHRMNPVGELPAVWRHAQCGGKPDPEIAELVNIIHEASERKTGSNMVRFPERLPDGKLSVDDCFTDPLSLMPYLGPTHEFSSPEGMRQTFDEPDRLEVIQTPVGPALVLKTHPWVEP